MATIVCSECDRELAPHCPSRTCTWLRCTNRACTAAVYDLNGERPLHRNGTVERYGDA